MRKLGTVIVALIVGCCLVSAVQAAGQTTIKLATLAPDGSTWHKTLLEMGGRWTEQTEGRVRLRVYPGGVAGDDPDMVRKMRIGQIQAAMLTVAGLAEIDPAINVFAIPLFFDSFEEYRTVLEKITPELENRLREKGYVLLHWAHGGWIHLFSAQPVRTIDQMKKVKLFTWAGDDRMIQLWKSNGFRPVALAATDILTGLQTGMIDAVPTTPLAALSMQWYRKTSYMTGKGVAPLIGGTVVTKKTWDRLSEADRAALLKTARSVQGRLLEEIPRQDGEAVAEMQKRGLTVTTIDPSQAATWDAAAAKFSTAMRAEMIPGEVFDEAKRQRDALRKARDEGAEP